MPAWPDIALAHFEHCLRDLARRERFYAGAGANALGAGISLVWVALYIGIAVFMASFGPLPYLLHRVHVV